MRIRRYTLIAMFVALFVGAILMVGDRLGQRAEAQSAPQTQKPSVTDTPIDDLQRSYKINTYTQAADSGEIRGETIYYFKCWVCHNKYTIAGGTPAPYLQDLYKQSTLPTGQPLTDENVATQIKNGNALMPAFRTSLSDTDLRDLLTYLKSGKCCEEGEDPPPSPWYQAEKHKWPVQTAVSGGAKGTVRISGNDPGDSPEGIKVQLIAPNGVRTTVYTNEQGNYEFPKMQTGEYTLRIATPLEFKPYTRPGVKVDGAKSLDDIVLDRIVPNEKGPALPDFNAESLPATPEIESQLSGAEILWNLSGTALEKDTFRRGCGSGCHSYPQIFRNHYDEHSWSVLVDRMMNYQNATLVNHNRGGEAARGGREAQQMIAKWLAKVRGPDSVDGRVFIFPRPHGASTRMVVTEYELPRQLLSAHDVAGDSKGNIWYSSHKSRYFGMLDPRTGIVKEHAVSIFPGYLVGTHRVSVDQKHNDTVWINEDWANQLARLDPRTGEIKEIPLTVRNFAPAPDGTIWANLDGSLFNVDPETGKKLKTYPMPGYVTYDNAISDDGKIWAGGGPGTDSNYTLIMDQRTGKVVTLDSGARIPGAARGGFDPSGNAWYGGFNGSLIEMDTKALKMKEHFPSTGYSPYSDFYEAMPDKNGEVWAGVLHGRGMLRYNPRTERWIEYALPEPFGHDRRTWIDNSTTPVTVWYVDYQGYIVRLQPLE